jgi:hypothetical protein
MLDAYTGATKPARARRSAVKRKPIEPSRQRLVCSICERAITDEAHAVERGGAHAHTFANPFGIVHRLRCFASATGVVATTAPSSEFTWFPGFTWVILACRGCSGFIGWRYRCGRDTFYGLLADRLIPG